MKKTKNKEKRELESYEKPQIKKVKWDNLNKDVGVAGTSCSCCGCG